MEKLDMKKKYKSYYTAHTHPALVEFDTVGYIAASGKGEPGGENFQNVTEMLFPVAYGIKKICKEEGKDFAVPPLEGLWWVEGNKSAREVERSEWFWKLMIRMPDYVTQDMVDRAIEEVVKKKKKLSAKEIKFTTVVEGGCVQLMHTGPYSEEDASIDKMYDFIKENNLTLNGLHHEIYLSDPRKTKPEAMKTILRQPVKKKSH